MGDISETRGAIRELTADESEEANQGKCCFGKYRYVVTAPYVLTWKGKTLSVPVGFLTDGSSGGPDYGTSWLYHDWLYSAHRFSSGEACTRAEADELMGDVLTADRMHAYCKALLFLSKKDPFGLFSDSWSSGGEKGPQFLDTVVDTA